MRMLLTFLKLFLLLLLPVCLQAQTTANVDSLNRLLQTEKQDTTKVKLLLQLALNYSYSRPDTALLFNQQALVLSRQAGFASGEVQSQLQIADAFITMGNYPKALALLLEALKKAEAAGDKQNLVWILINIGNIYTSQGDYRQSVSYYFKALALARTIDFQPGVLSSLLGIGDIYEKSNQLDSAVFYTEQGYQLAAQQTNAGFLATALVNLANIYSRQGLDTPAMNRYKRSLFYFQQLKDELGSTEVYLGIAKLFQKADRADSCLYYARLSLATAQYGGFTSFVLLASQFLTNYYSARNQMDSAFVYQRAAIVAKDSLFSQEKARQIQNLGYEEIERRRQIEQTKAEAQTRMRFTALFSGLFVLCVVAFLLWRNNRQKQKTNSLLYQKNEQIESALQGLKSTQAQLIQQEKMASLGELTAGIAHEIQNPLNFVNNFSDVNKELLTELREEADKGNIDEVKAIANDVIENEEKINHHGKRADAIVKGMLQHSKQTKGIKEPTDINALCDEYLRLSYHGMRAKDKSFDADFKKEFDNTIGKINVVPQDIGRVLLNLFNNAFYAVNEKRKNLSGLKDLTGLVTVQTKKLNDAVEIKVSDNGNGISQNIIDKIFQPFFTTKPTGQGTGLGLSLAYDIITKEHNGTIKVESREGEGTTFIINLPVA